MEKKLYSFAGLNAEKREKYNRFLAIKDICNLTEEEKQLGPVRKKNGAYPRIGNFMFEDGTQICLDLMDFGKQYEVMVYVAEGCKNTYQLYEYESREIHAECSLTPEGSSCTYMCVFLEHNTKKERERYLKSQKA